MAVASKKLDKSWSFCSQTAVMIWASVAAEVVAAVVAEVAALASQYFATAVTALNRSESGAKTLRCSASLHFCVDGFEFLPADPGSGEEALWPP